MHLMRWTKEAKDTIWLMGLQGVNYLVPLLVWPYLMIVLGAQQFGVFSFGIALAQYLMMLVDFGFNLTATKQIALAQGNAKEINRLFSATLEAKILLLLLSAIIVAIISFIPAYWEFRIISWITWIMVAGHTFSMFWLFQGLGKIRIVAIINAVLKLLILPLTFVLVKNETDTNIAAWIQVAVFVGAAIVTIAIVYYRNLAHLTKINWRDITKQLRSSWSIFLSNAATSTYTALFVVILALFVPADDVGRYSAAEKIMRCACYMVWVPISQAFFPRISRLSEENRTEGHRLVRYITIILAVTLGILGVVFAASIEPIVNWLGKDYGGIGTLSAVMAIIPMLVGIGGAQGQLGLIAMGGEQEKHAFRNVYLLAGLVSLASIGVFAWLWGAIGAAAALVVTEGTVCAGMCWNNRRNE